jgi:hypothetical protein
VAALPVAFGGRWGRDRRTNHPDCIYEIHPQIVVFSRKRSFAGIRYIVISLYQ